MKLHFLQLLAVILPISLAAAPKPGVTVVPANPAGAIQPALKIEILNDDGTSHSGQPIHVKRSSAADPSGKSITVKAYKDDVEVPVTITGPIAAPDNDGDGWAKAITIPLAETDTKTRYEIEVRPRGATPALTYRVNGAEKVESGPILLKAAPIKDGDLEDSKSLQSSLELGGGEDGSLLSLRARYGGLLLKDHEYARWFARLDADLTPSDDEASDSLIYGRVDAEVDALWRIPIPANKAVNGSVWLGLDATLKSDQDFDNWDAAAGVASWSFINAAPIDALGRALRISYWDGDDDGDGTPDVDEHGAPLRPTIHPFAFKISADHVYESEREEGKEEAEDFQVSARFIWLNRIYTNASLPIMNIKYHINLLIDVGVTWQPDNSDFHPETKISIEFQPKKYEEANMAFALTWAKGEFSPTFEDEDAFLAGLKWRF